MSKLSLDLAVGTMHPRETLQVAANLAALNAVTPTLSADGSNTVTLMVLGAYVGTVVVEGSYDNSNWDMVPLKPQNGGNAYVMVLASAQQGRFLGPVGPFKYLRARLSAWTSGTAIILLQAELGLSEVTNLPKPADLSVTITAAAGAAATLTLPAVAGLFHHITRLHIQRFASALLTVGATPVLVTTTNMPGARAFSLPADAAAQGTIYGEIVEPKNPLRASAVGTATTFVCPVTAGVIWRVTADYYLAL